MQDRCYYTYIVASRTHILYIGVTGNIERRMAEHKSSTSGSFTAAYKCNRLVWFERYTSPHAAIARETQLKGWRRAKKDRSYRARKPNMDRSQRRLGKNIPKGKPVNPVLMSF